MADEDHSAGLDEGASGGVGDTDMDEKSIEELKQRIAQMDEEAEKLRKMQSEVDDLYPAGASQESKEEVDSRSVYVGNVDYSSTPEELQEYFKACGTINRVTILCDKYTGQPKGYAYIEFAEVPSVAGAVVLNDTIFKGRMIKVTPKRTNVPFHSRGRGGRGGYRGGYRGGGYRGGGYRGYAPRGGYRGRGRGGYYAAPY